MIDLLNAAAKYVIALVIIIGCFYLIASSQPNPVTGVLPDNTQPWSIIALVTGWLIRDSAGNAAAANVATIAAAQPNVVASAGPPNTLSVTPSDPTPPKGG